MKFNKVLNETYWRSNQSKNKNGKSQGARNYNPVMNSNDFFKIDGEMVKGNIAMKILKKRLMNMGVEDAWKWEDPYGIYEKAKEMGLT
jgi:hypothetical protein